MPRLPTHYICAALTLALSASICAQESLPTVTIDGKQYLLKEDAELPKWLQIEVVVFRHNSQPAELSQSRTSSYPTPLIELVDTQQLAAEQAQLAEQRGIALIGEELKRNPHNLWQAALVTDLTTLYDPYFDPEELSELSLEQGDNLPTEPLESDSEVALDKGPVGVDLSPLQIEPGFEQLTRQQLTLRDSARAIERQQRYTLLSHFAWRQSAEQSSSWIAVQGGDPLLGRYPLEGAIRLVKSRFHHIETKLWWAQIKLLGAEQEQMQPPLEALLKSPLTLPALPEQLSYRTDFSADAQPDEPSWSLPVAITAENSELNWHHPLFENERWVLSMAPFSLQYRLFINEPISAPLALSNAYNRLSAAITFSDMERLGGAKTNSERPSELTDIADADVQPQQSNIELADSGSLAEAVSAGTLEMDQEQPEPKLELSELWSIVERRRVDAGNDYYIDHPVVGIVVRISEVEPTYTAPAAVELPEPFNPEK